MRITRTSIASGKVLTRDIAATRGQLEAWKGGTLIQDAMPHLGADDREFLITGMTSDEWDSMWYEEDK